MILFKLLIILITNLKEWVAFAMTVRTYRSKFRTY